MWVMIVRFNDYITLDIKFIIAANLGIYIANYSCE